MSLIYLNPYNKYRDSRMYLIFFFRFRVFLLICKFKYCIIPWHNQNWNKNWKLKSTDEKNKWKQQRKNSKLSGWWWLRGWWRGRMDNEQMEHSCHQRNRGNVHINGMKMCWLKLKGTLLDWIRMVITDFSCVYTMECYFNTHTWHIQSTHTAMYSPIFFIR